LTSRETAVRWFPTADLYEKLAEKHEEIAGNPLPARHAAVSLDPSNATRHDRVALTAELAGDHPLAEKEYLAAARLSRLYEPRFLLAQYYFRRQNADDFDKWSRAAFETAYGDVTALLDLCWHLHPDSDTLLRQAPPDRARIAVQFALFLAHHDKAQAAKSLAVRLAANASSEDLPPLLEYCNLSLYDGVSDAPVAVWNELSTRKLIPYPRLAPERGESLTNDSLSQPALGNAFDWRMEKVPWMYYHSLPRGIEFTFTGRQPESVIIASQYVPVLPGARYTLSIAELSGPDLDWIVYGTTGKPLPLERRQDHSVVFQSPAEVVRIGLIYQRPPGVPRLEGPIRLAAVNMELAR